MFSKLQRGQFFARCELGFESFLAIKRPVALDFLTDEIERAGFADTSDKALSYPFVDFRIIQRLPLPVPLS
jgi:hypothetical protein